VQVSNHIEQQVKRRCKRRKAAKGIQGWWQELIAKTKDRIKKIIPAVQHSNRCKMNIIITIFLNLCACISYYMCVMNTWLCLFIKSVDLQMDPYRWSSIALRHHGHSQNPSKLKPLLKVLMMFGLMYKIAHNWTVFLILKVKYLTACSLSGSVVLKLIPWFIIHPCSLDILSYVPIFQFSSHTTPLK